MLAKIMCAECNFQRVHVCLMRRSVDAEMLRQKAPKSAKTRKTPSFCRRPHFVTPQNYSLRAGPGIAHYEEALEAGKENYTH